MATRNVVLTEPQSKLIDDLVASGRYQNASEALRAGLRLLETNESKLEVLRKALIAGERSGRAKYSYESIVAELDAELR